MWNLIDFLSQNRVKEDKGDKEEIINKEEIIKDTRLSSSNIVSENGIYSLTFSEEKKIDTRIKTALRAFWIYYINSLLTINIKLFRKTYGVWDVIIKYVLAKIAELNNN